MMRLLDYGAGNVRSVINSVRYLGYDIDLVREPGDILDADKVIFPGVGNFGLVMAKLQQAGFIEPLKQRVSEDKPLLGICIALQTFFEKSEESPGKPGLGIIPGKIRRFNSDKKAVPQIGWNGIRILKNIPLLDGYKGEKLYFVHSYYAEINENNQEWIATTTNYEEEFISGINRGNTTLFQFHPEKSGNAGLNIIRNFLAKEDETVSCRGVEKGETESAKRVIACLDVRSNDEGDLVLTKGDQYDVREKGEVRNFGKPVEAAERYYLSGADEITFLNITGFRNFPLQDQPMLEVLKNTSEKVFVPLTIGGGIRDFTDTTGQHHSALEVASAYFRSGADKVSIGSDAVYVVENVLAGRHRKGSSSIEKISGVYGAQAVVISVDPRRVYVKEPSLTEHTTVKTTQKGEAGEEYCWYQCTVKGGREGRDVDVVQLVTICEQLGAGEILLNCIDRDGTNSGFDLELVKLVKSSISIPVIASSGAGNSAHFTEVFQKTDVDAALAAGIFHRREVEITEVKSTLRENAVITR